MNSEASITGGWSWEWKGDPQPEVGTRGEVSLKPSCATEETGAGSGANPLAWLPCPDRIVIDELGPRSSLSAVGANTRRLRGCGSLSTCTQPVEF